MYDVIANAAKDKCAKICVSPSCPLTVTLNDCEIVLISSVAYWHKWWQADAVRAAGTRKTIAGTLRVRAAKLESGAGDIHQAK